MGYQILLGNCLTVLPTLPAGSVRCVVTSPPYYGLRDYGTARWTGGDPACDHLSAATGSTHNKGNNGEYGTPYKHVCGKCGAAREDEQIGLEATPEEYIEHLVAVFREVRRVLADDGTLWVVIGDSYAGSGGPGSQYDRKNPGYGKEFQKFDNPNRRLAGIKPKDLIGIPWMFAFAMRDDGWYLRQDNIWNKPNPMTESVRDRCTTSHEHVFHFSKNARYYYDYEAVLEPAAYDGRKDTKFKGSVKYAEDGQTSHAKGNDRWPNSLQTGRTGEPHSGYHNPDGSLRVTLNKDGQPARNKRSVWTVCTEPYPGAHFATYPPDLITPCILAGSAPGDKILDPFNGSGTTGEVALMYQRSYIGIELNPKYIKLTEERLQGVQPVMDVPVTRKQRQDANIRQLGF